MAEGREYRDLDSLDSSVPQLAQLKDSSSRWIAIVERIFRAPNEEANVVEGWAKPELWQDRPKGMFKGLLKSSR